MCADFHAPDSSSRFDIIHVSYFFFGVILPTACLRLALVRSLFCCSSLYFFGFCCLCFSMPVKKNILMVKKQIFSGVRSN